MIQFDKNTNPVFQKTSEWLPDRFQSRDRFHSHESLYMRRVQSPQDLFVHHWQLFHCSVRLYGEGGGGERVETFFSCGNNCFYSLSTHPLVRGTARPQTQQSLISFLHSHSLCCHATPLAIARGHKKNSWLQTHRTWVKKGIWTIVFVGLSLVTYWNSLCPRLEKWKLCR